MTQNAAAFTRSIFSQLLARLPRAAVAPIQVVAFKISHTSSQAFLAPRFFANVYGRSSEVYFRSFAPDPAFDTEPADRNWLAV